jgi:hypothetical protein
VIKESDVHIMLDLPLYSILKFLKLLQCSASQLLYLAFHLAHFSNEILQLDISWVKLFNKCSAGSNKMLSGRVQLLSATNHCNTPDLSFCSSVTRATTNNNDRYVSRVLFLLY